MDRRATRLALAAVTGARLTSWPVRVARANGRFPGADQLVVDPADPKHLLVRATFGFVETYDRGASWHWICEEVVGTIGNVDPPIALTGDGTIVVAVPFDGIAVSHDRGCSWERAPAPLAGQLVVDMTLEPGQPSSLLALTSTGDPDAGADAAPEFSNRLVETKDDARSWTEIGTPLPRDFIASTIEVAASDPRRIYVGGLTGDPPADTIERSEDRGVTWTRVTMPPPSAAQGAFIGAIDPRDPDRLWVRILSLPPDPFGMAPTTLLESSDKAVTFTKLAETTGSMFGLALSPDGKMLAYGGQGDGIFVGPADGAGGFSHASAWRDRCLTWTEGGLYACGTEPFDPFAVGLTVDRGMTFDAVYALRDTCPQECPDESPFARVCRASWLDSPGVAKLTGATGETCSVPWAKVATPDAGTDGAAPREAGATEPDASTPEAPRASSASCACTTGSRGAAPAARTGFAGLVLLALRRRRKRALRYRG